MKHVNRVLPLLLMFNLFGCDLYPIRSIDENEFLTDDLLQAPEMNLESTAPPVFHPIFNQSNYETNLALNDLSYAIANDFGYSQNQETPKTDHISIIRNRIQELSDQLESKGWQRPASINGRTGRDNVDPDIPAIISSNIEERLIIIAFHGSRSGNKFINSTDGKGDWGSNHDKSPVHPKSVGLDEMPDSIRMHRGFANTISSLKFDLFLYVENLIEQMIEKTGKYDPIWIWTTGHSRGGALASIAIPLLKLHFDCHPKQYKKLRFGAIIFSASRAFQGDQSSEWVHNLIGRKNIFRINVHLDPVPVGLSRESEGYRSLGVLFLDFNTHVHLRNRQKYGMSAVELLELPHVHYLSDGRGIGFEFDPAIVIPYSKLESGFEEGRLYLNYRRKDGNFK